MSFFDELRRLSVKVEQDANDLQERAHDPASHQDIEDGRAVLLLRDTLRQVQTLRSDGTSALKTLRGDGSFLKLAQLSKALVDRTEEMLQTSEAYLQQYGYQPQPRQPKNGNHVSSVSNMEDGGTVNVSSTPEQPVVNVMDLDRTPTYEDFGISRETIQMLEASSRAKKGAPGGVPFKVPAAPTDTLGLGIPESCPAQNTRWRHLSDGSDVPEEDFHHQGHKGTSSDGPGINTDINAMDLAGERKLALNGNARLPANTTSQRSPTELRGQYENSPLPPVFATPGLKQFATKSDLTLKDCSPGKYDPCPKSVSDSCAAQDSPIPPLFKTPGVRQIQTTTNTLAVNVGESTKTSVDDERTPEAPTFMTPGIKQVRPAAASQGNCVDQEPASGAMVFDASPMPPVLQTPGVKQVHRKFCVEDPTDGLVAKPQFHIGMDRAGVDTPEPPEMTSSYGQLLMSKHVPLSTLAPHPPPGPPPPPPPPSRALTVSQDAHASNTSLPARSTGALGSRTAAGAGFHGDNPAVPENPCLLLDTVKELDTPEPPELTLAYQAPLPQEAVEPPGEAPSSRPRFQQPNFDDTIDDLNIQPQQSERAVLAPVGQLHGIASATTTVAQAQAPSRDDAAAGAANLHPFSMEITTPQKPELTGTYSFMATKTKIPLPSGCIDKVPVSNRASKECLPRRFSEEDKENTCRSSQQSPAKLTEDIQKTYVKRVSAEEYLSQPDYLQRVLKLDLMNAVVDKVNANMNSKVHGGLEASLKAEDTDLDPTKVKVFFLTMRKLGRLAQRQIQGEAHYVVPH